MENIQTNQEMPVHQSQQSSSQLVKCATPARVPVGNSGDNIKKTNNLSSRSANVEVHDAVEGLIYKYGGLIECRNIIDGNYELSIVDKNISNEKAQEILEAFKDVNVVSLNIINCCNITELSLKNFPGLLYLNASECEDLTTLDISGCDKLETLDASRCKNLTTLDVSGCKNLKFLKASVCDKLETVNVSGYKNLTTLDVSWCDKLETVNVSGCDKLETVNASWCIKLDVLDISVCKNLTTLYIGDCDKLETVNVSGCDKLETVNASWCENLTTLDVSRCKNLTTLDVNGCKKLENLYVSGCKNLTTLDVIWCENMHGELDISELLLLENVNARSCAEDFVVIISPYCNAATRRKDPNVRVKGQPSSFEKYTSILRKKDDITVAENIIRQILDHNTVPVDLKNECLKFLEQYCEQYGNMSEEEKTKASEKYMTELNLFSHYLNACGDAFATGFAKLKITLGIGEKLQSCEDACKRRQVLFGVYAQQYIESSIATFDGKYRQINRMSNGIGELVEVQLAMNIIFNVPFSKNMAYAPTAANTAKTITNVYAANADEFRDLVEQGKRFLEKYDGIKEICKEALLVRLGITEEEAQYFEVPLEIMITSMLKDRQRFGNFLLDEQEYWPLASEVPSKPHTLTVGEIEEKIGETDNTIAIKEFIQEHKGQAIDPSDPDGEKLSDNPTLAEVFDYLGCNNMENHDVYKIITDMTTESSILDQQQQSIIQMYSDDNYEEKLADHLQTALLERT